ncbi:MAG: rhomboid family intramembrane serine protease [Bacteroidota bacterium]
MIRGITDAVKHLLIINVVLFIGTLAIGNILKFWLSLYLPLNDWFKPWQFLTHMFMHADFVHILFNMFALWMFGTAVEQVLGTKRFLFVYFSAGLGAFLFQLGFNYYEFYDLVSPLLSKGYSLENIVVSLNETGPSSRIIDSAMTFKDNKYLNEVFFGGMLGASGCIMGVLAAFGMMNPEAKLMLIFLPIPIKAKYFIPGIIMLDVISAFTGQSFFSPSNTAYMAHIGGALTGFFIMWYWRKTQFNQNRWDR